MPDISTAGYLVDYLFEFGPVKAEGPLELGDIKRIAKAVGTKFEPWQTRLLLRMSREYKGEMHAATSPHAPTPYPPARKAWRWVQHSQMEKKLDAIGLK